MSDININLHSVFHDCLDYYDRFDFLKKKVANLTLQQQGELVVEAFSKMQDYIDMNKMSIEVLGNDEDICSITTIN